MMSASQNDMIAAEFLRIAAELDDEGANPYRIRAYRRAAGIIARLMEDAGALALRGELTKISGIGDRSKLTSWRTMTKSLVSIHTTPLGISGSSSERGWNAMR